MIPGYNPDMPEAVDQVSFRARVYLIVRQVPSGKVVTYGQVAAMIPDPGGADPHEYRRVRARWVGRAMNQAPDDVPWHRVINSQGKISLPAGSRSAAIQRMRLQAEGVRFEKGGAIRLEKYGWDGPTPEWAMENGLIPPPLPSRSEATQLGLFDRKDVTP